MRHTPLLALYLTPREFAMLRRLVEAAVASHEPARGDDWEALADLWHTVDAKTTRLHLTEAKR